MQELIAIFASDDIDGRASRATELRNWGRQITVDYSKRFRSNTATVARGVTSGIFGLLSGGKHPSAFATAGGTVMNVGLGAIKTLEATNAFKDKYGGIISNIR